MKLFITRAKFALAMSRVDGPSFLLLFCQSITDDLEENVCTVLDSCSVSLTTF